MARRTPEYLGEPTLGQVMRRPQWILALILALAVAAAFAWLGQWQMDQAVRTNVDELTQTEEVRPIDELTEPIAGIPEIAAGAVVSLEGEFIAGDFDVVHDRMNQGDAAAREQGAWIVGHLVRAEEDRASLAVAIGWTADAAEAEAAVSQLETQLAGTTVKVEGRYLPAEAPEVPRADEDPHLMRTMVPSALVNEWTEVPGPVYGGYLVLHPTSGEIASALDDASLTRIDSVAPSAPDRVIWLNAFYAIEWIVFAVIALYLWYRLARDAWEKEHELRLLLQREQHDQPTE